MFVDFCKKKEEKRNCQLSQMTHDSESHSSSKTKDFEHNRNNNYFFCLHKTYIYIYYTYIKYCLKAAIHLRVSSDSCSQEYILLNFIFQLRASSKNFILGQPLACSLRIYYQIKLSESYPLEIRLCPFTLFVLLFVFR